MSKNVLVTGAAGLIGSHLCDVLLEKGCRVTGIDNLQFGNELNVPKGVNFIQDRVQDLLWNKKIASERFHAIFHLASLKKVWNGTIHSSNVMSENFDMTRVVSAKAMNDNSKLIFTSTSDIYGNSKTFSEDEEITMGPPTNLRYSYALSKWHSEQYILNDAKENGLKAVIVRVFGCASHRSNSGWSGGHIPLFIKEAKNDRDIIIHGDGLQTRSISHAKDIAEGIFKASFLDEEIINLGTNQETTVKEVAEYIVKKTESTSKIIYKPIEEVFGNYNEIRRRFANIDKAKKLIDYKINYNTFEVIDEIIRSYK